MSSLANDLLSLATKLTTLEPGRPKQATLRRAISTAYYALFHFLIDEGTKRFLRNPDKLLRPLMARAFEHGPMKTVSQQIAIGAKNQVQRFSSAGVSQIPADLASVAAAFVDLQKARHDADYNLSVRFSRYQAIGFVNQARQAFVMWARVAGTTAATVYLLQLHNEPKR